MLTEIRDTLQPIADEAPQEVYRALCNVVWVPIDHEARSYGQVPYDDMSSHAWSWRAAAGYVAGLRGHNEDYMDFYCSGGEGQVSDKVADAMRKIGLRPLQA